MIAGPGRSKKNTDKTLLLAGGPKIVGYLVARRVQIPPSPRRATGGAGEQSGGTNTPARMN
jgi:hypothetical protein